MNYLAASSIATATATVIPTMGLLPMPLFHSDQGWQYQHSEYQRLLKEHNIIQSMSRKGNCMDNGAMENFFGRLKVEMFYGEKFESVNAFIDELKKYIDYYNNERISMKLKGMSPVQYRTHSQAS
jgi:putative transposase